MTRRRQQCAVEELMCRIDTQLSQFRSELTDGSLREKVCHLADIQADFRDLGVNVCVEEGLPAPPGQTRERLRAYLVEYVQEPIAGAELEVVAGISEYGRRIRELRVEQGYQIATGASPDPGSGIDLQPDEYLLVTVNPDEDLARRWHVANRIRRGGGGSKAKILKFLLENVGVVVTTEELAYVAKDRRQYARRTRELRTEEGYAIATKFTGRPDLALGQYVLQSQERMAPPHDRNISHDIQKLVYARDANTCRICGWNFDRWRADDPRILELHHIEEHQHGGPNDEDNLIVVCSKCHDEVHSGRHAEVIDRILADLADEG